MTTKEVLVQARALLSDPTRFTQEEFARDAAGDPVWYDHDEAVCYCVLGARGKVLDDAANGDRDLDFLERLQAVDKALEQEATVMLRERGIPLTSCHSSYSVHVNDTLGYDSVIELLDRTIKSCDANQ